MLVKLSMIWFVLLTVDKAATNSVTADHVTADFAGAFTTYTMTAGYCSYAI